MPPAYRPNLPPILPNGTQVVILNDVRVAEAALEHRRGAVATIIRAPTDSLHSYRVRFPDGTEAAVRRSELAVLSEYQSGNVTQGSDSALVESRELYAYVIYRCVIGSRAYGLDDHESDTDRRGIYLPPADLHWSLQGVPEQLENLQTEETYWEAHKFVLLALKSNPNVLECLYTPIVEHATPLAQELLAMRDRLLSKLVYQTYNGYVMSQFRKLQGDLRSKGQVKWKHVMHLLRLLLAGIATLRTGRVPVHTGKFRKRLLEVKRGERPFEECDAWRLALHQAFEAAFQTTPLPDRPDYAAANAWLLKARRSMVDVQGVG